MSEITQIELKERLSYCEESGRFVWLKATYNGVPKVGAIAGCINVHGYIQIHLLGKIHLAHRLAFLWMNGALPQLSVDHINGIRSDNRWANLRQADQVTNSRNSSRPSHNSSGRIGVFKATREGKWCARIKVSGRSIHLGYFNKFEDACHARELAEREHGFHKNHGREMRP